MKKIDLRIIKTKKMLFMALTELLKEKAFEEIKVLDLCEKAYINRSTFYDHYQDKNELLVDYLNSLRIELDKYIRIHIKETPKTKAYYIESIRLILNYLNQNKDVCSSIINNNYHSVLTYTLIDIIAKDINKENDQEKILINGVPNDITIKFYIGGLIVLSLDWLNNQKDYSEEELVNYLNKLIPDYLG